MLKTSILVLTLISLVNGHGHIIDPPTRNHVLPARNLRQRWAQGCNVQWERTFFNNFRCTSVCGNLNGLSDPDGYDNTKGAAIQRTYTSGQWITIKQEHTNHRGKIRVKLCKLSSPNENPTQACFDQNNLQVLPDSHNDNAPLPLQLDLYTVRKTNYNRTMQQANTISLANNKGHLEIYQDIKAKLPDGLTCDHCVLQFVTQSAETICKFADGTDAPFTEYCPSQVYFSCSDITILPDPTKPSSLYSPAPVSRTRLSKPVIAVFPWLYGNMEFLIENIKTAPADPLKFSPDAWGVVCLHTGNIKNEVCMPCIDETKMCPTDCYCRWYDDKALKFPAQV